jgi:hypothetical protein
MRSDGERHELAHRGGALDGGVLRRLRRGVRSGPGGADGGPRVLRRARTVAPGRRRRAAGARNGHGPRGRAPGRRGLPRVRRRLQRCDAGPGLGAGRAPRREVRDGPRRRADDVVRTEVSSDHRAVRDDGAHAHRGRSDGDLRGGLCPPRAGRHLHLRRHAELDERALRWHRAHRRERGRRPQDGPGAPPLHELDRDRRAAADAELLLRGLARRASSGEALGGQAGAAELQRGGRAGQPDPGGVRAHRAAGRLRRASVLSRLDEGQHSLHHQLPKARIRGRGRPPSAATRTLSRRNPACPASRPDRSPEQRLRTSSWRRRRASRGTCCRPRC